MGCFLACFGTSRKKSDHKPRKYRRNHIQLRDHHGNSSLRASQPVGSVVECVSENPVGSVPEAVQESPKVQPNASPRKKVTFDSNVRTYEHVPLEADPGLSQENEDVSRKDEGLARSSLAKSSSEASTTTSSLGSYPSNHRYQNCRDSDDEEEELEFGDSDLDDEDDEDDDDGEIESEDEMFEAKTVSEEVNSPLPVSCFPRSEVESAGLNRNGRDRSLYVHSVLNPVENLTQWKAVKAKGTTKSRPQKENFSFDQESRTSFSSEPTFEESSLSFKSKKTTQTIKPKQEMAVDASLSNWLVSPETTPVKNTNNSFAFDSSSPNGAMSQGSNSVRSHEDRPILGALTVDEIRQFSASSSPRKSPSRSPDEMPIIGTVGTYWSHKDSGTGSGSGSGSATSFKGIPNTTSKYREDNKVKWHNTPFETRLERALNGGETESA